MFPSLKCSKYPFEWLDGNDKKINVSFVYPNLYVLEELLHTHYRVSPKKKILNSVEQS